jgi:CHAD domain-containing protein
MKDVNPERTKEIHHARILAKKLRYQGECVNSILGMKKYDLQNLKRIQSTAGRVQNDNVLISTLGQFLAKKKYSEDAKVLKLKSRVEKNQKKLIENDFSKLAQVQ